MNEPLWLWVAFNLFVVVMILLDLLILHRKSQVISIRRALIDSALWIMLALLFNLGIYYYRGGDVALNFFTAYLVEKSLSIDNLFVFVMLFGYFHTPPEYQHKVLFWGILGAILMRAAMIFFGLILINTFHWTFYLFGAFVIYAGIKMALPKKESSLENNLVLKFIKKYIPLTTKYDGDNFFSKGIGGWQATPLFVLLLVIESIDFVFALDSIPAVMAITTDPFIVYTSNIFAILGLRSLYFALASLVPLFHFLNYALAAILVFIGLKMILEHVIEIPIWFVLAFISGMLGLAVVASLAFPKNSRT